ncbi:hypothetical protein FE236_04270 [Mariprofundus erugo]|uniref:hypothetical protein n=1 Tax=Mariprofundus erugo TaxID=2528639 RepID=UPI0010FD4C88|nr:hypothetical protein [Mariprofundus erugo]TLS77355.1 hypothetical protein FE236_04270 [Mariprofundus erugo]
MKRISLLTLIFLSSVSLPSCSEGLPKMAWGVDEGTQPAYAQGGDAAAPNARAPLDVPPELRAELEVPAADSVATVSDDKVLPENYRKAVAGKYVALDAKLYEANPGQVFSAMIDAMTALNLPVQSVDSPSGTLTTDWIRKGAGKSNAVSMFANLFDFGGGPKIVRYRYVVRVMRAMVEGHAQSQLEIRTIGQVYDGHNWVNAQLKQKVADDLFSAFEEQLASAQARAPQPAPAANTVAPATPVDEPVMGSEVLTNQ